VLDRFDLSTIYIGSFAIVVVSILLGYLLGRRQPRRGIAHGDGLIGSTVGSMLGLLAFIFAFTFGIVTSRFDTRKRLLLQDVDDIATATTRADLRART